MVTSGIDFSNIDGMTNSEIIDIMDGSNICLNGIPDFPIPVNGATGDLVSNRYPIICGGSNGIMPSSKICFKVTDNGKWNSFTNMSISRTGASSISIGDQLWVTGGQSEGEITKCTELISIDGAVEFGVDLPLPLWAHCMVKINENTIFLAGGQDGNYQSSAKTYFYNIRDQKWTSGPDLGTPRHLLSCGVYPYDENSTYILTIGGRTSKFYT